MSLYLPESCAMPGFEFFEQDYLWLAATPRNFLRFQIGGRITVVRGDVDLCAPELDRLVYSILFIYAGLTAT